MSNEDQIEYWNGEAGARWAEEDATMAQLLEPLCEALLDQLDLEDKRSAIDVGCGGGSQSLMLARRMQPGAKVLGVDISGPLLEVAAEKSAQAGGQAAELAFLQADASDHPFKEGSFDLLFSRFGVMFFDKPEDAFRNLRRAMSNGGQLAFLCWQGLKKNDWTLLPFKAALEHIPMPETPPADAPGPFAFADPQRVSSILEAANFRDITVSSHVQELKFAPSPSLAESVRHLATIGPVSRLLADQTPDTMEKALLSIEQVLAPFYRDGALHMDGATWMVTASTDS